MSDDFDKLRPTGDEDDSDDESLDWKKEDSKKSGGASSGESLGFTGELNWRKDVEDAFGEQLDAASEDAFDWQQGEETDSGGQASSGFGFTGQLDWKKVQPGGDSPGGDENASMDWLRGADETPETSNEVTEPPAAAEPDLPTFPDEDEDIIPAGADDSLAWLNQFSAADSEAEESGEHAEQPDHPSWLDEDVPDQPSAEPAGQAAMPSWLDEPTDTTPAEASEVDVPSWLSDDIPSEKPITEGGQLSADWLAGADQAPETASSDMSFDEWQRIQDDVTRPRDIDEEMPDLFSELQAAPPVSEDDLPPATDTGQLPSWVLGMDELNASDAPDWLTDSQPETAPPASPASASDDIFGDLGLPSPETGYDLLDQPAAEEDLLAGLNLGGTGDVPDWFAQAEAEQPAAKDTPDWLQDLGDLSEAAQAPTLNIGAEAVPAEDDFLAELRDEPRQPAAEINPLDTSGLQDIDSLLASYEVESKLPSTDDLVDTGAEIDRLLSDDDLEQISSRRAPEAHPSRITGLSPDAPEWLTELGANVDEVSAAAIVRKQTQKERPLDELSDRLQALHERGLEIPASEDAKPSEVLRTLLPGVTEVLPPAPLQPTTKGGLVGDLVLTDAQRQKINLLKTLVGTDEEERRLAPRPSAIDLTLATPNLADLGVEEEPELGMAGSPAPEPEPVPVSRPPSRRFRPKFDRLLIALFLTVAVLVPFFVGSLRIGDLPPAQFASGSRQLAAFNQVDGLHRGDLALIAAEYGPTGAGELDTALDALLRHVLMQGARPVIVSGNPIGLLHARNILNAITADTSFLQSIDRPFLQTNQDYYVVRYLAASAIGLRAFSEDIPRMLSVDANGQATNLGTQSLKDFALIAVIAESAEEIRGWAEQVAPLAGKPLVAVTGQAAAPLSEPYVIPNSPQILTGLSGLLVGYRDAYTYRSMLDARMSGAAVPQIPTTEIPETPTVIPETPEATSEATTEGGAASQAEATSAATPAEASPTPESAKPTKAASATPAPTDTPTLTPTATDTPTPTFTPSPTATFEPAVTVRGVVDSNQSINVREGPGKTFTPIGSLTPGAVVQITGRNGDGSWLKVKLDDGREGWVSASLISVEEPPATTPEVKQGGFNIGLDDQVAGLIIDVDLAAPAFQATPAPGSTSEADARAGAQGLAPLPTPVISAQPPITPYRDERWYGMTLGLVAIIVVIAIGMIANIFRGLFRRGK